MQMRSLVCGCISEWFESGLRVTLHVKKTKCLMKKFIWWEHWGGDQLFPNQFYVTSEKKNPATATLKLLR